MIPSAVFVPAIAIKTTFHSPAQILRNLGSMLKTSSPALSTTRKHKTGLLLKSFGECCVSTMLTSACYKSLSSCSEVCARVGRVKSKLFTVGVGLRQGRVLSPLLFIVNISGSQLFRWREPNPDLRLCWRASLKFFKSIRFTRFVSQQNAVCYTKY